MKDFLEPLAAEQFKEAKNGYGPNPALEPVYILSIAISLKRIADAMHGRGDTAAVEPSAENRK